MDLILRDYLESNYPNILSYPEVVLDAISTNNHGPFRNCNYERFQEIWVRRAAFSPILWAGNKVLVVAHNYTLNHSYRNYFYIVVGLEEPVLGVARKFQNQYLTDLPVTYRALTAIEQRLVVLISRFGVSPARSNLYVSSLGDNRRANDQVNSEALDQIRRFENLARLPDINKIYGTNIFGFSLLVVIKKPRFTVRARLSYPNMETFSVRVTMPDIYNCSIITPEIVSWFDKLLTDHTVEVEIPKSPLFNALTFKYRMEVTSMSLIRHAN